MATQEKGRALPKFGEWDVNNPASAEGFTVIFTKARDEKKSNGAGTQGSGPSSSDQKYKNKHNYHQVPAMVPKKWWRCFG